TWAGSEMAADSSFGSPRKSCDCKAMGTHLFDIRSGLERAIRRATASNRKRPPCVNLQDLRSGRQGDGSGGTAASLPSEFAWRFRSLIQATIWANVLALVSA